MSHTSPTEKPALLGGTPVVSEGPPPWPISDAVIASVFMRLQSSGAWGKYHAEHTQELISTLQEQYQTEQVLLTSSGTAAVELALRGLNVGAEDEVILAAYEFKANFTNVALLGATPVLVDIDRESGQLDVDQVAAAFSARTKAILTSHLHGGKVDMVRLRSLADEHNIAIIEDCCQVSSCAKIDGCVAGSFGDVAVLSFGGSKILTSGRGGAVLTNRADIAQRIRLYNQRGNEAYPLSEMQAAVLVPQLNLLEERHQRRMVGAEFIREVTRNGACVRPFSQRPNTIPDYYKLGMWYDETLMDGLSRDQFCVAMRAEGIPIDSGFSSLHRTHARRRFRQVGELDNADYAHGAVVVLHHPFLLNGQQAANQFREALDKIQEHATILSAALIPQSESGRD